MPTAKTAATRAINSAKWSFALLPRLDSNQKPTGSEPVATTNCATGQCAFRVRRPAASPGLEPELPEPKSSGLPITPQGIVHSNAVALEGIEPTRPVGHRSLNPARLPCFATGLRCLEMVGSDPVPGTDQLASPVPHRGPKPTQGIEPRGEGTFLCPCPPSWAPRADDGHRTRDIHFGRVTLCQLSYIRVCPEMLHRRGQSALRCGRLAVHLTPIGAAATPQPVLTPEDLRAGRSRTVVGCGTAAAYLVPGTTRWYVCGSTPPHFSRRTPPGSRTPYPLIKSQVLWPDELEAHIRLPARDLIPLRASGTRAANLTEG